MKKQLLIVGIILLFGSIGGCTTTNDINIDKKIKYLYNILYRKSI